MSEFNKTRQNKKYRLPIAELYPDLTLEQQQEAEYFLTQYLETIHRIYEESENLTSFDLNTTV